MSPPRAPAPVRWARSIAVLPIRVYQRWISPFTPATCRFQPTCSGYTLHAILTHGVLKGGLLGFWRVLRCNPFGRAGIDPVPPLGRWKADPPQ